MKALVLLDAGNLTQSAVAFGLQARATPNGVVVASGWLTVCVNVVVVGALTAACIGTLQLTAASKPKAGPKPKSATTSSTVADADPR
eukprot:scaffold137406_cov26-Prasinocladus_malaysianus.AAC.1